MLHSALLILTSVTLLTLGHCRTLFLSSAARGEVERKCAALDSPWTEARLQRGHWGHIYRLRVLSMSRDGAKRTVFPEEPLFRYVRRVYRCCQMGFYCRGVKGIQGRDTGGKRGGGIEFVLSEDVLSAPVLRAELHLHVLDPQPLSVRPLLPSLEKRQLPTRHSVWSENGILELRVDLSFFFQAHDGGDKGQSLLDIRRVGVLRGPWASDPREKTPGEGSVERPLEEAVELGLALHCSKEGDITEPCDKYGVQLLHTPFITLSYR
ncbi:uncharacterized protein si:ch211-170d8.2 [Hoplias malabaricus]|uniref:uncharacterized protein si:ch211-170d8.2 n=1 Tax=Hoplias malabaricus TaxID=27720 RepID=UPI003461A2E8